MQKEMVDIIRGNEINIDEFFESLPLEKRKHSETVAQITNLLLQWALEDSPFDYQDDPLLQIAGEAARFHDIGLVLIPDRIINKKEDLTGAEFRVLQQHTSYGSALLDNYRKAQSYDLKQRQFWGLAAEIALGHHERWDGKGYPLNQLATAVPTAVRAVAIADAFDSIVRGSCYRMELPVEYAMLEIKHNSGRQFDPMLGKIFCEHFDTINQLEQFYI